MKDWIRDVLIILVIFTIGIIFGFSIGYEKGDKMYKEASKLIQTERCLDSLTDECLLLQFNKNRIKFSYIVLAQAKLESNNYKSKLVFTHRNLFGMKVAAQRFSFATNYHDYGSYAKYESIEDCITDYKAWQLQSAFFITAEEQYFELLSKIYASDKQYVNKLKQIINGNSNFRL